MYVWVAHPIHVDKQGRKCHICSTKLKSLDCKTGSKVTKENIKTIKCPSAINLFACLSLKIPKACLSCGNKRSNSALCFPSFIPHRISRITL